MTQADHKSDANPPPTDDDHGWIDDASAPFRLMVDALVVCAEPLIAPRLGLAVDTPREGMYVEQMHITLPFELDLQVRDDGRVRMAGAPPTQYTRTSVMPVFHSMSLNVKAKRRDG